MFFCVAMSGDFEIVLKKRHLWRTVVIMLLAWRALPAAAAEGKSCLCAARARNANVKRRSKGCLRLGVDRM